jgi:hypothetical protein
MPQFFSKQARSGTRRPPRRDRPISGQVAAIASPRFASISARVGIKITVVILIGHAVHFGCTDAVGSIFGSEIVRNIETGIVQDTMRILYAAIFREWS